MLRSVLLLDDDAYFHRLVAPALRAQEVRLLHAYSLAEADTILEDNKVDAMVVDSHLPDGEGEAWIVGRRNRGDLTPVIFVSAFERVLDVLRKRIDALQPMVLVTKPIVPTLFAAQVRSLFGSTGKSAQIARPAWLDELRRDYRERLPDMIRGLRACVARAKSLGVPGATDALDEALHRSHSLRTNGGSYGFFKVSEAAGRLEDVVERLKLHNHSDAPAAWGRVEEALGDLVRAAAHETQIEPLEGPQSAPTAVGAHVLVLDADDEFRALVSDAGKRQLIDVTGAANVPTAISLARSARFDGVVLEAHLNGAETFGVGRELRAMAGYEHLPIAFMSSDTSLHARVEAVHAGASLYLKKPLDLDALSTALRDLVHETSSVRPRALVVDSDASFGAAVVELLRVNGIDARALSDPKAALSAVEYFRPDVLLAEMVMPVVGGLDLCRILRTTPPFRTLPILLMSNKGDVETRIQAFEAGADDHIGKPLVPKELLARVRGRLDRQRLLRDRAERDSLTGLLLRGPVVDALVAKLADAQRKHSVLSVALIDLDGFKDVNDTYGHLAGDRVLVTLGRLLATRFRAEDLRGRWGGEEFLVAFPGEPSEVAEGLVLRVLRELRETRFSSDQDQPFHITFSAGVATYPSDGLNVESLLKSADRRLYSAKHAGKNRVICDDGNPSGIAKSAAKQAGA
ncbi:MAG: diguanylate cyclase [Polyangiaceae bacterium]|nr:diguanylate cyclase [Polyangiaceae bacterium]